MPSLFKGWLRSGAIIMDKRLFIFLGLFFLAFFAYQKFVLDPMSKKVTPPASSKPPSAPQTQASAPVAQPQAPPTVAPTASSQPETTAVSQAKIGTAVVETSLYRAEFLNRGAVLKSFRLKKYPDDFNQPLEMVPQDGGENNLPLSLDFDDKSLVPIAANAVYSMSSESLSLQDGKTGELTFQYSDGNHTFKKKLIFKGGDYLS
jgi:YidC/Oxa1 family membrane protein insertase